MKPLVGFGEIADFALSPQVGLRNTYRSNPASVIIGRMRPAAHLRLLGIGFAVWAAFFLAGLPDYYQQYSFELQVVVSALLIPPTGYAGWYLIKRARAERRKQMSVWLAFYFTVPLLAYDTLYCGLYLGHGASFLALYWYLTIFYVIPWILYLPMGWWHSRNVE